MKDYYFNNHMREYIKNICSFLLKNITSKQDINLLLFLHGI